MHHCISTLIIPRVAAIIALLLPATLLGITSTLGAPQAVGPSIDRFAIGAGAGNLTGGKFQLSSTAGQPDSGSALGGGTFTLVGGFWPASVAPVCPADITANDTVNIDDLLMVINTWGACPARPELCPADISSSGSGDGIVDIDDLLTVINAWGPCP